MAKYCAFCGKKMGNQKYGITGTSYEYCQEHYEFYYEVEKRISEDYRSDVTDLIEVFKKALNHIAPEFEQAVEAMVLQMKSSAEAKMQKIMQKEHERLIWEQKNKEEDEKRREEIERKQEIQRKKEEEKKQIEERYNNMLLTTGSSFDGYTINRYIDIISEEVVFKNSFLEILDVGIDNLINMFSFRETELSVSSEIIKNAKEYVMKKFRRKAAELGANAVLGVDFENSFGSSVVQVAVSGTAVVISKKSE